MPELLVRYGYSIIGAAQYNTPFLEVLNAVEVPEQGHGGERLGGRPRLAFPY